MTNHEGTKTQRVTKAFLPLSKREEDIGGTVVNAAYQVHSKLGPGLLESIYEVCFCHELQKCGLSISNQVIVPIIYDDITFSDGFRLDVLVEDLVVVELKAVESLQPVFTAQLLTYLKLTSKRLGYLINFNVPLIKDGIKRVIL